MGRFGVNDADNYGSQGGGKYFSLKNDKDVARVRFLYDSIDDVEGYAVHEVEVNGRKKYVNCLRSYNEPLDDCPFCREKKFQLAKLFVPIYNVDEDSVQIWERGKKFFQKISSISSRYPNICEHVFEIERNGAKGDTQTTYEIYEIEKDGTKLEDLPEAPEIVGMYVLDKSFDDMEAYLNNGYFPDDGEETVTRRRGRGESRDGGSRRRTPGGRRSDSF